MAQSRIDEQMSRMQFLMEYKNTPKTTKTGIDYHINANDGKTYGIIREGNMYYIKTTTPDKAELKESYEYMGGYNYRNEHGYKSFNEASKHLELEIMHINESCGKHEDVSVLLDPQKGKKDMQTLTESARTELDRIHQIFENSCKIGHYNNPFSDPESKGSASSENTTKNNAPFEDKAEASLDKDPKFNGTVDGATPDNKEVKGVDADLESDKMKKHGDSNQNPGTEGGFKDAHDDLEGEGVADKHPSGAKAVKMNEGIEEIEINDEPIETNGEIVPDAPVEGGEDLAGFEDTEEVPGEGPVDAPVSVDDFETIDSEEVGDLDELLREFMEDVPSDEGTDVLDECGDTKVLDGPDVKGDNSVSGEETMERIEENADNTETEGAGKDESKIVGPDEVLDGPHGKLDAQTWNKLQESIDRITDAVCEKLAPKKKPTLAEAIDKIVKEEVSRLDAWGKHPRYQEPAFQTPENKEVSPNDAKDWNDDSARGSEPYGKKIGSSAPFDKQVSALTEAVMAVLRENYIKKK